MALRILIAVNSRLFWAIFVLSLSCILSPTSSVADEIFGYKQAIQLLEQGKPSSVEDYIRLLPKEIRSQFILIHHSQSQEQTSFTQPRILLFNRDATLLLAVSGNPESARGKIVEIIRYDEDSHAFIPTEIDFSNVVAPTSGFRLKDNPSSCYSCHGTKSFHPNWRSYDTWPDAFGNRHAIGLPSHFSDQLEYQYFRANLRFGNKERYSLLEDVPTGVGPLAVRNSHLTSLLAIKNTDRISQFIIDAVGDNIEYYPAIFQTLMNDSEGFIQTLQKLNPQLDIQSIRERHRKQIRKVLKTQFQEKQARMFRQTGGFRVLPFLVPILQFDRDNEHVVTDLLVLKEIGIDVQLKSWSTSFKDSTYEFATPTGSIFHDIALRVFDTVSAQVAIRRLFTTKKELSLLAQLDNRKNSVGEISGVSFMQGISGDYPVHVRPRIRIQTCEEILTIRTLP